MVQEQPNNEPQATDVQAVQSQVAQGNFDAALSVTDWKGHNNYSCMLCGGREDSLDHNRMITHVQRKHGPPPAPQQRVVASLVDRFGNPVVVDEAGQPKTNDAPTSGIGAQ